MKEYISPETSGGIQSDSLIQTVVWCLNPPGYRGTVRKSERKGTDKRINNDKYLE